MKTVILAPSSNTRSPHITLNKGAFLFSRTGPMSLTITGPWHSLSLVLGTHSNWSNGTHSHCLSLVLNCPSETQESSAETPAHGTQQSCSVQAEVQAATEGAPAWVPPGGRRAPRPGLAASLGEEGAAWLAGITYMGVNNHGLRRTPPLSVY